MNDEAGGLSPLQQLAAELGTTLGSLGCFGDGMKVDFKSTYFTMTADLSDELLWRSIAQNYLKQNSSLRGVFFGVRYELGEEDALVARAYMQARAGSAEELFIPTQMRLLRARVAALGTVGAAALPRPVTPVTVAAPGAAKGVSVSRLAAAPIAQFRTVQELIEKGVGDFRATIPEKGALGGEIDTHSVVEGDIMADGKELPSRSTPHWRRRRYVVAVGEGGAEIEPIGGTP